MGTKDWKTAAIEYADMSTDRRRKGCAWCPDVFSSNVPGVLIDSGTGGVGSVFVVHTDCVEPMRQRARLGEMVAELEPLYATYVEKSDALSEAEEGGEAKDNHFYARDDSGVAVADQVGELLELVRAVAGMTVTVLIENTYSCGRESRSRKDVPMPAPDQDLDSWWTDEVYDLTGDGHSCGASEHAMCEVRIVAAPSRLELVGESMSWEG